MTETFRGFGRGALTFLRQLKKNNRREWFQANKETYDNEVLAPLRLFVEEVDVRFGTLAPEFVGDPKRSIFRIYRDVRFSKDKSPYKTHAACWFKHQNSSEGVGLPRGFAPGHPAEKWLRYQSFTAGAELSDADVLHQRLVDKVAKDYRTLLPIVRWLNQSLGYRERRARG